MMTLFRPTSVSMKIGYPILHPLDIKEKRFKYKVQTHQLHKDFFRPLDFRV